MKNEQPERFSLHKRSIIKASIKATEVKITKNDTWYDSIDQHYVTNESAEVLHFLPHEDLTNAIAACVPYLAHLCEFVDNIEEEQDLSKFTVTGFSIGGDGDHEGVVLVGQRKLRGNRVLNLVSPFTKWDSEHDPYEYGGDLAFAIRNIQEELEEYINGKCAPAVQLSLELS